MTEGQGVVRKSPNLRDVIYEWPLSSLCNLFECISIWSENSYRLYVIYFFTFSVAFIISSLFWFIFCYKCCFKFNFYRQYEWSDSEELVSPFEWVNWRFINDVMNIKNGVTQDIRGSYNWPFVRWRRSNLCDVIYEWPLSRVVLPCFWLAC